MKYTHKPTEVEATQWHPGMPASKLFQGEQELNTKFCLTRIDDEYETVNPGDWVVIEPSGYKRIFSSEEFDLNFQPEKEQGK